MENDVCQIITHAKAAGSGSFVQYFHFTVLWNHCSLKSISFTRCQNNSSNIFDISHHWHWQPWSVKPKAALYSYYLRMHPFSVKLVGVIQVPYPTIVLIDVDHFSYWCNRKTRNGPRLQRWLLAQNNLNNSCCFKIQLVNCRRCKYSVDVNTWVNASFRNQDENPLPVSIAERFWKRAIAENLTNWSFPVLVTLTPTLIVVSVDLTLPWEKYIKWILICSLFNPWIWTNRFYDIHVMKQLFQQIVPNFCN